MAYKPSRERWCKHCECNFELTNEQLENDDVLCHQCGEESIDAAESGIEPDSVTYSKENPR